MTVPVTDGPARVEIWDRANTTQLVASVQIVRGSGQLDDTITDTGAFKVTIGTDVAGASHVVAGNHLRVYNGAWMMGPPIVIEDPIDIEHLNLDRSAQVITLSCRGGLAHLADAPIGSYGGIDALPQATTREYNAGSPEIDISVAPWIGVTVRFSSISQPYTTRPWWNPWYRPKGLADNTASWVWSRAANPLADDPYGDVPFAFDVAIPADGMYQLQVAANATYRDIRWNGMSLGLAGNPGALTPTTSGPSPGDDFIRASIANIPMTAGTGRLFILGSCVQRTATPPVGTFGGFNHARVAWCLYRLDSGTDGNLTAGKLVAHSDGSGRCIDYPATQPAPNFAEDFLSQLDENQAINRCLGVTTSFTRSLTTDGQPWADIGPQSLQLDTSTLLDFARSAATSGLADVEMASGDGLVVDAWNFGTKGVDLSGSIDYEANATSTPETGLVNFHETTIAPANSLDVRWQKGRFRDQDATSITANGAKPQALNLAQLDEQGARTIADAVLLARKNKRSSFTADLVFTAADVLAGNCPYGPGGWRTGDTLTLFGDTHRVMKITTKIDPDGWFHFIPTFENRLVSADERAEIRFNIAASGTLGGTAMAAQPLPGINGGIVSGRAQDAEQYNSTLNSPGEVIGTAYAVSGVKRYSQNARLERIDYEQAIANTVNPTTIQILNSGTVVATISLIVGDFRVTVQPDYCNFSGEIDALQWRLTNCDPFVSSPASANVRLGQLSLYAVRVSPQTNTASVAETPW